MEISNFKYRPERYGVLNSKKINQKGKYVLYWMQRSQRAEWNMALEYAIQCANEGDQGVVVCFGLMKNYPEATARHYHFMLEGLQEVEQILKKRNIKFVLQIGEPQHVALQLSKDASLVVCDKAYLKNLRQWRLELAEKASCIVLEIEDNVVVPVETTSDKQEYAARTIRKKIQTRLNKFREEVEAIEVSISSINYSIDSESLSDIGALISKLNAAKYPAKVDSFKGGTSEAKHLFDDWLKNGYDQYDENRNQPHLEDVSHQSAYLHFGQISPLWLLWQMKNRRGENKKSYVEELVVRRELAINFVYYNDNYDSLKCLPDWANDTLAKHKSDKRDTVYTREQLENAETDDPYWNKAMNTMKERGYLHNHMRMYWGKRIIAYTDTPEYAHEVALELNNKYFLDGRDANSFTNVAWLFGNHDRAWTERKVFGKVRIMTQGGLERKIDTKEYLSKAW